MRRGVGIRVRHNPVGRGGLAGTRPSSISASRPIHRPLPLHGPVATGIRPCTRCDAYRGCGRVGKTSIGMARYRLNQRLVMAGISRSDRLDTPMAGHSGETFPSSGEIQWLEIGCIGLCLRDLAACHMPGVAIRLQLANRAYLDRGGGSNRGLDPDTFAVARARSGYAGHTTSCDSAAGYSRRMGRATDRIFDLRCWVLGPDA